MVRRKLHRFCALFRQSRKQCRNRAMHFADGETPVHTVMDDALHAGERAQDTLQMRG